MFDTLDAQLKRFSPRLRDDLKLTPSESAAVATTIADELTALSMRADDDPIAFGARCDELTAFQGFMDASQPVASSPFVARARVLVQNYVCFVYLKEAWLEGLREAAPATSVLHRCASYLTAGKVRAFRNALSHARWRYLSDFSGLEYWDRASGNRSAPLQRFEVTQLELDFWQTLIRAVCYTVAASPRSAR